MSNIHKFTFLCFIVASLPAFAAGGVSHGGGDALICFERPQGKQGLVHLSDNTRVKNVYLADTFSLLSFKDSYFSVMMGGDENIIYKVLIEKLNRIRPNEGTLIDKTVRSLQFKYVKRDLPELEDDNIQVPRGCYKKQLAIQSKGPQPIVLIDQRIFDQISNLEKALLKIHEAYIRIYQAPSDTTALRKLVKQIVKDRYSVLKATRDKMAKELTTWDYYQYVFAYAFQNAFGNYVNVLGPRFIERNTNDPSEVIIVENVVKTVDDVLKRMHTDSLQAPWAERTLRPNHSTSILGLSSTIVEEYRTLEHVIVKMYRHSGRCKHKLKNLELRPQRLRFLITSDPSEYVYQAAYRVGYAYCGIEAPIPNGKIFHSEQYFGLRD